MLDVLAPSEEVRSSPAVVVLESSVWAQGLPAPVNLETALEVEAAVREEGAVPAITVVDRGKLRAGLTRAELEELCSRTDVVKVGCGDLPGILASGGVGATTVSASLVIADLLGLPVFSTGGLGGVHRGWQRVPDVSADLRQLGRTRCTTVCSGCKSVLDVPVTLEALEALGVPILLYQTDNFPEFYTPGRKAPFGTRLETPEQLAQAARYSLAVLQRGAVVTQVCPEPLSNEEVEAWIQRALEVCVAKGKAVTPFLLSRLRHYSQGATLDANRRLLVANARLAARMAVAWSRA